MTDKLLAPEVVLADPSQEVIEAPTESLTVGQWFWVKQKTEPWFACITHIGTNYVELTGIRESSMRIHFDEFDTLTTREPNAEKVIQDKVDFYQGRVNHLLGRVKEVTAQLAIHTGPALPNETQALAVRGAKEPDMKAYGTALEKAKDETLPELFKKVEEANASLARWMTATVIPLKAQARGLDVTIDAINDRIFSVELYAGLVEKVTQIQDGNPAQLTEKVHLLQRRCYMDEECLAQYEAGGMSIENLDEFEAWLLKPKHLERILPFQRCIVSFQVRRKVKQREMTCIRDIFSILAGEESDKFTYLYIRNGERVFRLCTKIQFGEKLFPDINHRLQGKLWAKTHGAGEDIITDHDYQERVAQFKAEKAAYEKAQKAYDAALKTPEAKARAKKKGIKHPDASCVDVPWPGLGPWRDYTDYKPYDKANVYFDDITAKIQGKIKEHNRIGLVLQGLLDRSPVLHPHPPWQIWTQDGFESAFVLIYDDTRALVAGDKPDFEAYRQRLNKTLKTGSITVGQEDAWERHEAKKECDRRNRDPRWRGEWRPTHYRPDGDPGPGRLARVAKFQQRAGKATFLWTRQARRGDVTATLVISTSKLLNVEAYKPGDFKQFFDDPRTRMEYLQWAPLLLEAEEYHAGNRKVPPLVEPIKKRKPLWENQIKYMRRKQLARDVKRFDGATVKLLRDLTTTGGARYEKDTLWKAGYEGRGLFYIRGISPDGRWIAGHYVGGVEPARTLEVVAPIPDPEEDVEEEETKVDETEDTPEDVPEEGDDFEDDEEEDEDLEAGEDEDFDEDEEEDDEDE